MISHLRPLPFFSLLLYNIWNHQKISDNTNFVRAFYPTTNMASYFMTYLRRLCIFTLNHYATSHIIYLMTELWLTLFLRGWGIFDPEVQFILATGKLSRGWVQHVLMPHIYCNEIQRLDVAYECTFTSNLWGNPFLRENYHKVLTHLVKILTTSLDSKRFFCVPCLHYILTWRI